MVVRLLTQVLYVEPISSEQMVDVGAKKKNRNDDGKDRDVLWGTGFFYSLFIPSLQ